MNKETQKEIIGRNIKAERTRAGMTRNQVAEALNVEERTVQNWEYGTKDTLVLISLMKLFKCDISSFVIGL